MNAALGPSRWASSLSVGVGLGGRCCRGAARRLLQRTSPRRRRRDLSSRRVLAGDDVGTYFSNDIARKPSLDEGESVGAVGQRAAARAGAAGARGRRPHESCRPSHLSYEPRRRRSERRWPSTSPTRAGAARAAAPAFGVVVTKAPRPWRKAWKHWPTRRTPFLRRPLFLSFISDGVRHEPPPRMTYGWHPACPRRDASPRETHRSIKHRSGSC